MNSSTRPCKVIVVCGSSSGVGKSTLVDRLSQLISNASALYFDAYQATTEFPPDLFEDLANGKDVDPKHIRSPLFYRDLCALREGRPVVDPWNREVTPGAYLIVEEPFGREREGMAELIDYIACIQLPMDIALARRLLRNLKQDFNHLPTEERIQFMESTLLQYLNGGRIAYQKLYELVAADCDLILDGLETTDEMALAVITDLKRRGILQDQG
ncbi:hypothetical protein WMW72_22870 [Paenibacillus filicis]|uniref:Uridine kinase n=1 Tax=Paenibacillus filicis TaxID=669464 RepID=A0ABU9DSN4_9BACL